MQYGLQGGKVANELTKDGFVRLWLFNGLETNSSVTSTRRNWKSQDGITHFAAFFSAVIAVDNGYFRGNNTILWDSSCIGATCIVDPLAYCVRESDCAIETVRAEESVPAGQTPTAEQQSKGIRIFVAFTGYDAALTPLLSAGMLPTKYRAFSWSPYLFQLVCSYNCVMESVWMDGWNTD